MDSNRESALDPDPTKTYVTCLPCLGGLDSSLDIDPLAKNKFGSQIRIGVDSSWRLMK
jgi:hypothetical protein